MIHICCAFYHIIYYSRSLKSLEQESFVHLFIFKKEERKKERMEKRRRKKMKDSKQTKNKERNEKQIDDMID